MLFEKTIIKGEPVFLLLSPAKKKIKCISGGKIINLSVREEFLTLLLFLLFLKRWEKDFKSDNFAINIV